MKECAEGKETEMSEAKSHPKKFLQGALDKKAKVGKSMGKKKRGMKR